MHILITGGAGFIGSALARHLAAAGHTVTAVDNHSRQRLLAIGTVPPANGKTEAAKAAAGTPDMDRWRGLEKNCRCVDGDINDAPELFTGLPRIDAVVHCAGQVGIASSLADPAEDARNNITGTVQLLEALRRRGERPPVVFFSSNKVYGDAVNRLAAPAQGREAALLTDPWADGISETFPAAEDGLTPYGCSKRAAELYLLDAARRERFPAYILRCSCIYGPGQSGAEDQGWVSHVIRRRAAGGTVRVFGDGRQTRDLLYIDDLADLVARLVPGAVPGGVYNAGGGRAFARSLTEVVNHASLAPFGEPRLEFFPIRLFDQRVYYTDTSRAAAATGWRPVTSPDTGIPALVAALATPRKRPVLKVV